MNTIFEKMLEEIKKQHDLVLVTIIAQKGSSPRGLGAQMLADENGRICGSVGGGAVEHQCLELALECLKKKESVRRDFTLRHGSENDIGMVCGGDVTAWLQFVDGPCLEWQTLCETLLARLWEYKAGWLALNMDGAIPGLLNEKGEPLCGYCSSGIPQLKEGEYFDSEKCFFMPLEIRDRAVIFGGGHCAQALVPFLSKVGFRVTVMDNRPDLAVRELFPDAEAVICGDYDRISDHITLRPSDYVVIMTNGHDHDLTVQLQVLRQPVAYVGVIGSRSKKAYIQKKLCEAGIPEEVIESVHSPIGTPIKAVTPEEIAISITGEMIYERALLREAHGVRPHGCPMH